MMDEHVKKTKLILSLYACEPNRGSEPGVGWNWALGMAKRHDTYVLTRANNRGVIEAELAILRLPSEHRPKFIWVDCADWVLRLKKRKIIGMNLYYFLWQIKARKSLDKMRLGADIIHHVTMCSFVLPGLWWGRREKIVIGRLVAPR